MSANPTPPLVPPPTEPVVPPTEPVVPPVEPPKQDPPKQDPKLPSDNPIVIRYADKLKTDLGKAYSSKFDNMPLEQRVIAMEAAVDVLNKTKTPTKKGETETPMGEPAPKEKKWKTTLQMQQEDNYGTKLRHKQSAYHRTSALLNKK